MTPLSLPFIAQAVAACMASHPMVSGIADTFPAIVAQVRAHAEQESGREPLVIHVNKDRQRGLREESRLFASVDEAAAYTATAVADGRSVDVGVMGVNLRAHPRAFPTLAAAFDPATNICAGAIILGEDYRIARAARCLYNTGRLECHNGYPEAIAASVRRLRVTEAVPYAAVAQNAPPPKAQVSDPSIPAWDIYGQAQSAQ